jgi:hypothetical protein
MNNAVASSIDGSPINPVVTALTDGGYFGAWTLPDFPPGASQGVGGRIINADGSSRTNETVLNFTTANDQFDPNVAQLSGGNVVLTFTDSSSGTNHVRARLFNSSGTALGADFLADGGSTDSRESDVAALGTGFAVSYTRDFGGGDNDIRFSIFDSAGTNINGSFFTVDSDSSLNTSFSSVARLTGGNLVVAFEQSPAAGGNFSVWSRLFDNTGTAVGPKVLIDNAGSTNRDIQVAALQDGGYAVAYTDNGWGISGTEITAKIFNADGSLRSGFLLANTTTSGNQDKPTITTLSNGYFLVGWEDEPLGFLQYQAFDPSGNRIGNEFSALSSVVDPEIVGLAKGHIANVWESTVTEPGGGGTSIRSAIYELDRTTVVDGANNTLVGDELRDFFTSNGGDDVLVYKPGGNADIFTDFVAGALTPDRIDLTAFPALHTLSDILALATQSAPIPCSISAAATP